MSVKLKMKIGGAGVVEIDEPTLKAAIQEASLFAELPKKCGKCDRDDLALQHRQAKGYDFYGLRCRDCGAEFPFGQKREGGVLFPKGPWEHPRRGESHPHDEEPPQRHYEEPSRYEEEPGR